MPHVIFALKNYLTELAQQESVGMGRPVPTSKELAKKSGMSEVTFSRMINNDRDAIPREALAAIITELRDRGFDPDFNDLFRYVE